MDIEKSNEINGLVVLDMPLKYGDKIVYGILINKETEEERRNTSSDITGYVEYLAANFQLMKLKQEEEGKWTCPEGKLTITSDDNALLILCQFFMKGMIGFKVYEFDDPLEWNEDELDEEGRFFIVKPSLIKRIMEQRGINRE